MQLIVTLAVRCIHQNIDKKLSHKSYYKKERGDNFKINLNGCFFERIEIIPHFLRITKLIVHELTTVEYRTMMCLLNVNLNSVVRFLFHYYVFFPMQVYNVYYTAHFFSLFLLRCLSSHRTPTKWHCFIGQSDKWQLSSLNRTFAVPLLPFIWPCRHFCYCYLFSVLTFSTLGDVAVCLFNLCWFTVSSAVQAMFIVPLNTIYSFCK